MPKRTLELFIRLILKNKKLGPSLLLSFITVSFFAIFIPIAAEMDLDRTQKFTEIFRNYSIGIGGLIFGFFGLLLAWSRVLAANKQAQASYIQAQTSERSLLATAETAAKQMALTTRSQLSEAFSKSIEQLGSQDGAIRLGGILSLEQIARESSDFFWPVMESLSAYVRRTSPWDLHNPTPQPAKREDVQAILDVISRRNRVHQNGLRISLNSVDYRPYDFHMKGDYSLITFSRSNFSEKFLTFRNFQNSLFMRANMRGCDLDFAILTDASFYAASLNGSSFNGAKLEDCDFDSANLADCKMLPDNFLIIATVTEETILPSYLQHPNPIEAETKPASSPEPAAPSSAPSGTA